MADVKISGLPASTTPLAGTEVLPIVQGGVTKQVASNDLTVKNVRSNATTGILQVTGPAAGTTRVMTTPDANFTAARTDAAQSFTDDQTLSTGNLIIGTSGKGIDFSATAGTGTSELLADYEEGTWSPTAVFSTSNGDLSYDSSVGFYTKIGRLVHVQGFLSFSETTASGNLSIGGLPFAANTTTGNYASASFYINNLTGISGTVTALIGADVTANQMAMFYTGTGTSARITNTNTGSTAAFAFSVCYQV